MYFSSGESLKQLNFKTGDPLPEANLNFTDLRNGTTTTYSHFPKEVFGIPFDVAFIPVKNVADEIVAVFTLVYSMENQEKLQQLMDIVVGLTNQLVDSVQHVAAHSEELSATSEEMLGNTKKAVHTSVGLNAAIEAARVGDAGAGFGVVAKEIRKLSVDTKNATNEIEKSLLTVRQSIELLDNDLGEITASSQEQAELVSEFMETINHLNETTRDLKQFIQKLINIHES
ncbi:methyl-accepting chemotaxis protein [Paenibacillus silvae]|uniref:methyl-accepting chemotaxis protein n=1 Tax=Paenibacillus silvae TaxID=1325358 RepID=UPI001E32A58A|nr:methyl-accepting chemotaxis protein [Paenibacillus silvae]